MMALICEFCNREIAPGGMYVPGDPPRHLGCGQRERLQEIWRWVVERDRGRMETRDDG